MSPSNPRRRALRATFSLVATLAAAGVTTAQAQMQRPIPARAVVGQIDFGMFPAARLDGKPIVLAPGVRIFDLQNMQVLPGALTGQRHQVVYITDAAGSVNQIWMATNKELAEARARHQQGTGWSYQQQPASPYDQSGH